MGLTVRKKKGSVDSGIIKHATRILTLSQKLQKWHLGNLQTSKYLVVGVRHRLHLRLQVGTWNRLQVCIFVCKSAKRPFWGVFFSEARVWSSRSGRPQPILLLLLVLLKSVIWTWKYGGWTKNLVLVREPVGFLSRRCPSARLLISINLFLAFKELGAYMRR